MPTMTPGGRVSSGYNSGRSFLSWGPGFSSPLGNNPNASQLLCAIQRHGGEGAGPGGKRRKNAAWLGTKDLGLANQQINLVSGEMLTFVTLAFRGPWYGTAMAQGLGLRRFRGFNK